MLQSLMSAPRRAAASPCARRLGGAASRPCIFILLRPIRMVVGSTAGDSTGHSGASRRSSRHCARTSRRREQARRRRDARRERRDVARSRRLRSSRLHLFRRGQHAALQESPLQIRGPGRHHADRALQLRGRGGEFAAGRHVSRADRLHQAASRRGNYGISASLDAEPDRQAPEKLAGV